MSARRESQGQKESGVRRQFLITNSTNMVAFLTRGEKAVECGQSLLDITSALSCKVRSQSLAIEL